MNTQSFFLASLIVALSLSIFTFAGATTVENEIHVKASTGGNTAGNVQEGTSRAEVFVETIVDGQVVEHVEERKVEESANPVEIEVHAKYENGEADVQIFHETEIETQKEAQTETQVETEEMPSAVESEGESKSFLGAIVEFFRTILDKLFFA